MTLPIPQATEAQPGRATDEAADALHALVFEALATEIQRYRDGLVRDADGNPLPIPPALLAQAIKALKDNGVDVPTQSAERVDTLKSNMPDFDALEMRRPPAAH